MKKQPKRKARAVFEYVRLSLSFFLESREENCVNKHVSGERNREPEACDNRRVSEESLQSREYSTTAYHHHEKTRSNGSVFSESGHGEVEYSAPHDRCAKSAKDEVNGVKWDLDNAERERSGVEANEWDNSFFSSDSGNHQANSNSSSDGEHCPA